MGADKQKILLIKLSSLGDVIFTIPLANTLKSAGYELTWLVSEKGVQLVENNPCVDKTIFLPLQKWRKNRFSISTIKEQIDILKQLRAEKFDIAIDAQMMFKSLFWFLFCGAKRRITSNKARELSILGGNEWVNNISYSPDCPICLNYLKYAEHLGIKSDNIKVSLPPRNKKQIEKADKLLADLAPEKPIVVIAPATTWENKHWNKEHWKVVVESISEKCNLVFTGTPADDKLIKYISGGKYLNLAGKTDIMELIEIFSRAALVVAPDSGSTHLAWACGKPAVVAIFTCTPKNILGPYGNPDKYVSIGGDFLSCQPCFHKKCKFKTNECSNIPSPEEIIDVIHGLIF